MSPAFDDTTAASKEGGFYNRFGQTQRQLAKGDAAQKDGPAASSGESERTAQAVDVRKSATAKGDSRAVHEKVRGPTRIRLSTDVAWPTPSTPTALLPPPAALAPTRELPEAKQSEEDRTSHASRRSSSGQSTPGIPVNRSSSSLSPTHGGSARTYSSIGSWC